MNTHRTSLSTRLLAVIAMAFMLFPLLTVTSLAVVAWVVPAGSALPSQLAPNSFIIASASLSSAGMKPCGSSGISISEPMKNRPAPRLVIQRWRMHQRAQPW